MSLRGFKLSIKILLSDILIVKLPAVPKRSISDFRTDKRVEKE